MCEKNILIWHCGCTNLQDPRPCPKALSYQKPCDGYAFAWAFRDPISKFISTKCPSCITADETATRKRANEAYVATSNAYPTLRSVATGDDSRRIKTGRPRYSRTASESRISLPKNWTPEMNRLPSNANEYSAFLSGKFDPLVRLPDTHDPNLQQEGTKLPSSMPTRPQPMPAQQGRSRSRVHVPPQCWQEQRDGFPYVEFRGVLSDRPRESRRPSYNGKVQDKGWTPPCRGTLPPQSDVDTAPPSQAPSPQLRVTPSL